MDILGYGDSAVMIRFAGAIDRAMSDTIVAATARLDAAAMGGVLEVVPAERSILLHYDPLAPALWTEAGAITPLELLASRITDLLRDGLFTAPPATRAFEIPVCYGGDLGPDLTECAERLGMSDRELVELHSGAEYTVAMIGFLPGFPYLAGLPDALALPRLESPRPRVPAGSVAIGGARTGIYPIAAPGGWRIIGRSSVELFDAERTPPALLAPGDRVTFRPVAADELDRSETRLWQ
jgi:KipI family sensor histidine kinase inhibitor